MQNSERRKDIRTPISVPASVVRRGGAETLQMIDASYRGLFLRFASAPNTRELLKLRIDLPTRQLEINAVVVRTVFDALGRPGVGLRFFALNGQDKADWEGFVSEHLHRYARAA